jgi:dUTPase
MPLDHQIVMIKMAMTEDTKSMNEVPNFKFAIREDLKDTGNLFLPTRGTDRSTGWDVRAAMENRKPIIANIGTHLRIPLGFRTFVPDGWWYELKPRSSTFSKKKLHGLYGTIDEDYEGQLLFACQYLPDLNIYRTDSLPTDFKEYIAGIRLAENVGSLSIEFGEAIGQIIPVRRQEMTTENISNEEYNKLCHERNASRGAGGFGSTDR